MAIRTAAGTNSCRISSRLATSSELKKLIPVRLPPGRARLVTRPSRTGSSATAKTIGIVTVAALAAIVVAVFPIVAISDLSAHQFDRQFRRAIQLILSPAVFDRYVLALDVAGFLQALPE